MGRTSGLQRTRTWAYALQSIRHRWICSPVVMLQVQTKSCHCCREVTTHFSSRLLHVVTVLVSHRPIWRPETGSLRDWWWSRAVIDWLDKLRLKAHWSDIMMPNYDWGGLTAWQSGSDGEKPIRRTRQNYSEQIFATQLSPKLHIYPVLTEYKHKAAVSKIIMWL